MTFQTPHPAPTFDLWTWTRVYGETWAAGLDPAGAGRRMRERRLSALMTKALRDSPLYRRRQPQAKALADFEPVAKTELMADFDAWATDRRITRQAAERFIRRTDCIADAWLDDYLVWTSSGTSGHPGIFVQDATSLAVYDAIDALRLRGTSSYQPGLGLWGAGRSYAFVGATGGHFAGHASLERLRRIVPPGLVPGIHVLSVLDPLVQVAEQLQALQPAVLITYPSCGAALARMQLAGTLNLHPVEIWLGGEQLWDAQRQLMQRAFGCRLRNAYGASEFYSIAFECQHGHLHLNDDWVILEAMDENMQPVAPGEFSSTTLLTNLANLTQPLLRYRLDDCLRFVPGRCACGNAFPVIEVQGRSDDTLHLPGRHGQTVTILPLALETAIEEDAQVTQFQILQHADGTLELRLESTLSDPQQAIARCRATLKRFLSRHGVTGSLLKVSTQAPLRNPVSGKLQRVVNLGGAH